MPVVGIGCGAKIMFFCELQQKERFFFSFIVLEERARHPEWQKHYCVQYCFCPVRANILLWVVTQGAAQG